MTNFTIPVARPDLPDFDAYVASLRKVWESRSLSNHGPFVQELERIATEYLGVPTLAVSSGDTALICAIAALGLPKGAPVFVPSFTFQSTVNAVLRNGLMPILLDVDPDTFSLTPEIVMAAMYRVGQPAAIVATHTFGVPADLREIERERFRASIIYDAAHAYGATLGGESVARRGDVSCFSLSGTKVVTSAEGGLVSSLNPDVLDRVRRLRNYGFEGDYNATLCGVNGKLSELHAALGCLTLPSVDVLRVARAAIVMQYRELLGTACRHCDLADAVPSWKDFAVLLGDASERDFVQARMAEVGIETKTYFRPLHEQPAYLGLCRGGNLAVTADLGRRVVCLPCYAEMTPDQVAYVVDVFLGARAAYRDEIASAKT